jgi:hypothetical protein
VIADTRTAALSEAAEPEVYLPFWQSGAFSKHFVVRAAGDPHALAAHVRSELRAIDPTSAVERIAFSAVALAACLLPAYRASRVELMAALRQE